MLFFHMALVRTGVTSGVHPSPHRDEKANDRAPSNLQPLPLLPCLSPRGGAWGIYWPPRGGGALEGLLRETVALFFPFWFPI